MFEHFFGLSENPFNLTPDPKFIFLSKVHQEALSHLRYGIEQRKGFVLITGEVGAGKTTVCRTLLSTLPKKIHTAMILNPSLSDVELLQAINQDFRLPATHTSKKALLDELYEFLIQGFVKGENAVIIIDECQNLSPKVLEQIRMLSNLETEKEKLLQILMLGQPELARMLSAPSLKQINDRIVLRYHMWPLSLSDTKEYIYHRLTVSGSYGTIKFTNRALRLIYKYSQGVPRKINAVAERSLLIAYLMAKRKITGAIVSAAIKELHGNYETPRVSLRFLVPATLVIAAIIIFAFLWPSFFPHIPESLKDTVIATTEQITNNTNEKISITTDITSKVIPDYDGALEILSQIPGGLIGPDVLNLHPVPGRLKDIVQPSITSVENGYLILMHADDDYVRVVGKDKAVLEMPMENFKSIYKWNVVLTYAKPLKEDLNNLRQSGEEIHKLQTVLKGYGYTSTPSDGIYDIETVKGIERLQEDFGLRRDGIIGPETLMLISLLGKEEK